MPFPSALNEAFYTTLRVLLEHIAALRPLQETLLDILRLIESQFPLKHASISLLSADGLTLAQGFSPSLPPAYMEKISGMAIGPCEGSCGTAAYTRAAVFVRDINTDPLWNNFRALASPYGYRSCWSLPILDARGKVLGTFAIYGREPAAPTPEELELVKNCVHIAGIAISSAQADARLREQASLLDKAHDAIIVRDLENRIKFWNRGAERLFGWTAEEVLGKPVNSLLYSDASTFEEGTRHVLEYSEWQGELQKRTKDGKVLWVEGRWSLVCNDEGTPISILAIDTDISQRKASEREIHTLAFYDSLTCLPNRQLLRNRLDLALRLAARSHASGALLFLDLDNFKSLNDTQGHDVGDKLLRQVAQRLSAAVRDSDTVARIGGDEFVVLLLDLGSGRADAANLAQATADKILRVFEAPFDLDGYEARSTPSIGVAVFNDTKVSVDELLKRADLAMYQAKAAGRNLVRFFDPEMQAAVSLRVQMENDLRRALVEKQFALHYQAQVDDSGYLTGAEALIRWQHPKKGFMSPAHFIPIAESSGLILQIGTWVLETACAQLAAWVRAPARHGLSIAVNVSARQFKHPDFASQVQSILRASGAPANRLKLELTESLLLDSVEETIVKMQVLRDIGVSFSLDDFGTGYSSLAYLKRLPLAQLKIDPSFVRDILNSQGNAAIARTVIELGRSLGLNVIAEGVETETQRDLLYSLGCKCYQGYLFSRPISIEQFEQLELRRSITRPS